MPGLSGVWNLSATCRLSSSRAPWRCFHSTLKLCPQIKRGPVTADGQPPPLLWEKWLLSSSPPKGPLSNSRSIWQKRRHRSHHRPPLRVGGQLKLLQRTLALLACMSGPVYQPPMMEIKTCDRVHERFFPSQNKSQISTSVYSLSVGRDRAVPASYHRPLLSPPPGQVL